MCIYYLDTAHFFKIEFIAATAILIFFFRKKTVLILCVTSVLYIYYYKLVGVFWLASGDKLNVNGQWTYSSISISLIIYSLVLVFLNILVEKISITYRQIFLICIYPIICYLVIKYIHVPTGILIISQCWYALLFLNQNVFLYSKEYVVSVLQSINPFWISATMIRESHKLTNYLNSAEADLLDTVKSGFFHIIKGFFAILAIDKIDYFLRDHAHSLKINDLNINENLIFNLKYIYLNSSVLTTLELWVVVLYAAFYILFHVHYGYENIIIGIGKLYGLRLTSPTHNIWQSTSFGDFFRRGMYYYALIINKFFQIPFMHILNKLNLHRKARNNLAMLLSVYIGGLYFHILRDINSFFITHNSFENIILYIKKTGLYFFLMGLFCCMPGLKNTKSKLKLLSVSFAFFTLYALLFTLYFTYEFILKNRSDIFLSFYSKLLGI